MKNKTTLKRCNIYSTFILILFMFAPNALSGATVSWTGSVNGDWNTGGNWNTGTVPTKFDDVTIIGNIPYNITIASIASCKSLFIGTGVSRIYIFPNGLLNINGQNTTDSDLLTVPVGNVFENHGTLNVKKLITSVDHEAIDISGIFINDNGATLNVSEVSYTGTTWVEIGRRAIVVRKGGSFENDGNVNIDEVDGNGFIVSGSFRNLTSGNVTLGDSIRFRGIHLTGGVTPIIFDNYGTIYSTMNESSFSTTLKISAAAKVYNYGLIKVENSIASSKSISILGATLNNELPGNIVTIASNGIEIGGLNGLFVDLKNKGNILLEKQNSAIGTGISINDGGNLKNSNLVSILGYSNGIISNSNAYLYNYENATLYIVNADNKGISNSGIFENFGQIDIKDCRLVGIGNIRILENKDSGIIDITGDTEKGIYNSNLGGSGPNAQAINKGIMNMSINEGLAVHNSSASLFKNTGKLNATTSIYNGHTSTFEFLDTINTPTFTCYGTLNFISSFFDYVITGDMRVPGNINFSISSNSIYDRLKVLGDLEMTTDIHIEFKNGYIPNNLLSYNLIECQGIRKGLVEDLTSNLVTLDHSIVYNDPNVLRLKYNQCGSTPQVNLFVGTNGNWSNPNSWSLNHVPYPCEEVEIYQYSGGIRTLNMDINNTEISKLTININTVVNILQGKTLLVNRNFETSNGKEAVLITTDGELNNYGTLNLKNVLDSKMLRNNNGIVNNNGTINISHGYKNGTGGISYSGIFNNNINGIINVEKLYPTSLVNVPSACSGIGTFNALGQINSEYKFSNAGPGIVNGNGIITVSTFINDAILNPGNPMGPLTINGDLEMQSNSIINFEVDGSIPIEDPSSHDGIALSGDIITDGSMEILSLSNTTPYLLNEYQLISYMGENTGDFTQKTLNGVFSTWDFVDNSEGAFVLLFHKSCLTKNVVWNGNGTTNSWNDKFNWVNNKIPKVCQCASISRGFDVEIPNNTTIDVGYTNLNQATLDVGFQTTLYLHGNESTEGIFNIKSSDIINNGNIYILNKDKNNKPGIKIDKLSTVTNNGRIKLESPN